MRATVIDFAGEHSDDLPPSKHQKTASSRVFHEETSVLKCQKTDSSTLVTEAINELLESIAVTEAINELLESIDNDQQSEIQECDMKEHIPHVVSGMHVIINFFVVSKSVKIPVNDLPDGIKLERERIKKRLRNYKPRSTVDNDYTEYYYPHKYWVGTNNDCVVQVHDEIYALTADGKFTSSGNYLTIDNTCIHIKGYFTIMNNSPMFVLDIGTPSNWLIPLEKIITVDDLNFIKMSDYLEFVPECILGYNYFNL